MSDQLAFQASLPLPRAGEVIDRFLEVSAGRKKSVQNYEIRKTTLTSIAKALDAVRDQLR